MASKKTSDRPPAARGETIRSSLRDALCRHPATARELSSLVGVMEKDIANHLEHLERSLRRGSERLVVEPARCLRCDFVFRKRNKLTRPSSCPQCGGERIDAPTFAIR
jgi:predicted Zn-ribbon and HTH transcriptional regulator